MAYAVFLFAFCVNAAQFSLTLENDCFLPAKAFGKGDHDYTHGTCFELVLDSGWHLKAGQNMYAPSDLRRSDHIVGDRPYAGFIYGGIGRELFVDQVSPLTHYAELDFGMIGPAAFAGHTQKFIHKVLDCKVPKGWNNQPHNEFVVNGQWWSKYNYSLCEYVMPVPRIGILAGTVQDAIEAGCDLKVGWNLQKDAGNSLMFSSSIGQRQSFFDKLCAYVYIGTDERY